MSDFISVVQSVGFPIAVAVAMFIMLQREEKEHKEETGKLTETMTEMKISFNSAIHEQQKGVTEAINNNTLVIQKLLDKLEKE